jgi:MFS family permease
MNKSKLSKNVIVLGLVSFFNDFASEMVYPIVPIFLTSVLRAPMTIVGLIEGVAEATASLLKTFSGWLSDKFKKRKFFVSSGYSLSTISKLIIGISKSWPLVLVGRFIDRFGKGIRTSARDALIAESSNDSNRGRAFGFHRALDTLGAVVGPLTAIFLIQFLGENLRPVFYLAFIPGVIAILLLITFVKEKRVEASKTTLPKFSLKNLSPAFKIFLIASIIFAIGNSSDAFLILRAKNVGLTTALAIFAYVIFNIFYAIFSTPAGILSDKIGPKKLLVFGFFFFAFIYFLFGINQSSILIWLLFALYGIYMALTEGVGKAYISQIGEKERLATSFGIYQTAIGICTFFASLIAGILWSKINPSAPFIFGSILALIAGFIFLFSLPKVELKIENK